MKRKRYVFITLLILLLTCRTASAKKTGGGDIWSFLELGVGAKSMALGGAYVAVADDASASYWNPAGLGQLKGMELMLMHTSSNSVADMGKHQYISASIPTVLGSLGASLINFNLNDIPYTEEDKYGEMVKIGEFQSAERALALSYGRSLGKWFYLGANLRRMDQRFLSYSSSGLGWDIGFIISARQIGVVKNFKVGYIFKNNLGRKWKGDNVDSNYEETGEVGYRWGVGVDPICTGKFNSTIAFSFAQVNDAPSFISLGGEIRLIKELVSIRGGVNNWYAFERRDSPFSKGQLNYARQLASGIGVRYSLFQVDYAAIFERFGLRHLISLTLRP